MFSTVHFQARPKCWNFEYFFYSLHSTDSTQGVVVESKDTSDVSWNIEPSTQPIFRDTLVPPTMLFASRWLCRKKKGQVAAKKIGS